MRKRRIELVAGPTAVEMLGRPVGLPLTQEFVEMERADYEQLLLEMDELRDRVNRLRDHRG